MVQGGCFLGRWMWRLRLGGGDEGRGIFFMEVNGLGKEGNKMTPGTEATRRSPTIGGSFKRARSFPRAHLGRNLNGMVRNIFSSLNITGVVLILKV